MSRVAKVVVGIEILVFLVLSGIALLFWQRDLLDFEKRIAQLETRVDVLTIRLRGRSNLSTAERAFTEREPQTGEKK